MKHSEKQNYEVAICATHFIGDGLSMHQLANEFFSLLGSIKTDVELKEDLVEEWHSRSAITVNFTTYIRDC